MAVPGLHFVGGRKGVGGGPAAAGENAPLATSPHRDGPIEASPPERTILTRTASSSDLLNIVYLTTEAVPFAKTGGLADVCGKLPERLAALGHRTAVIMPAFRSIYQAGVKIEPTDMSFAIPMEPGKLVGGRLLESRVPGSDVRVWFIDQPQYFARESLYGTSAGDYPDNAERFAFFCRAALMAISRIGWQLDILHCNDWQTGLVPAMIAADRQAAAWRRRVVTWMAIHNLAYQGHFPRSAYRWVGMPWSHFRPEEFEYYDHLNFLKTGIVTADRVCTVSPRYAAEICTPEHGCGLDAVLRGVGDRLHGILNGIDDTVWDPATDPYLTAHYDVRTWKIGKLQNKRDLQQHFGLPLQDDLPMIGLVGRLADQKGWDLILDVLRRHLNQSRPTQWVILGSGDARIEQELGRLKEAFPARFGLHIGFSDELAHRIEAASDLFVMPSRYEPCGLNQLYSTRYGAVPVVTPTGGLADTVIDCTPETVVAGTATGFHLKSHTAQALDDAINLGLRTRYHDEKIWEKLVETGMSQDWSWRKSAAQYAALYEESIALSRETTLREVSSQP